jgi:hypothetical protein
MHDHEHVFDSQDRAGEWRPVSGDAEAELERVADDASEGADPEIHGRDPYPSGWEVLLHEFDEAVRNRELVHSAGYNAGGQEDRNQEDRNQESGIRSQESGQEAGAQEGSEDSR